MLPFKEVIATQAIQAGRGWLPLNDSSFLFIERLYNSHFFFLQVILRVFKLLATFHMELFILSTVPV